MRIQQRIRLLLCMMVLMSVGHRSLEIIVSPYMRELGVVLMAVMNRLVEPHTLTGRTSRGHEVHGKVIWCSDTGTIGLCGTPLLTSWLSSRLN